MNNVPVRKTIVVKGLGEKIRFGLGDLYPVAGIVGIITYIVAACLLE